MEVQTHVYNFRAFSDLTRSAVVTLTPLQLAGVDNFAVTLNISHILQDRHFYPGGNVYFETCTPTPPLPLRRDRQHTPEVPLERKALTQRFCTGARVSCTSVPMQGLLRRRTRPACNPACTIGTRCTSPEPQ